MSANLSIVLPGHSPLGNRRPVPAAFLLPARMTCASCGVEHDIEGLEVTDEGYHCTPCLAGSDADVDYVRALRWRALTGPALLLGLTTACSAVLVASVFVGAGWVAAPSLMVVLCYAMLAVGGFSVGIAGVQSALRTRRLGKGPITVSDGLVRANQLNDGLIVLTGLSAMGLAAAAVVVGVVV